MAGLASLFLRSSAMFSRKTLCLIRTALLCTVVSGYATYAHAADDIQLTVVPDKCISLLKGQTCYQNVRFRWNAQRMSGAHRVICLWREGEAEALTCRDGELEGTFRYKLEAAETTTFYLVAGRQQQPVLDSTTVTINWVYSNRSKRRSRWRLF